MFFVFARAFELRFGISPGGEIGRHKGLKIPRTLRLYRFKSGLGHHLENFSFVCGTLMNLIWYKVNVKGGDIAKW